MIVFAICAQRLYGYCNAYRYHEDMEHTQLFTSFSMEQPLDTAPLGGTPLFARDDLLAALETYEDLPFDLILDASVDLEFSPLESPTAADRSNLSATSSPPISTANVPRSQQLKAERTFLRDQIVQLERELASLKATVFLSQRPSAWRDVANRQRARRTATEQENERLRAKLLRQVQIAKSLEVVLHRRGQNEMRTTTWTTRAGDVHAWKDDLGQVLRHFVADIDHAYKALDAVLPETRFDVTTRDPLFNRSVVKAHVVDGIEQLYVETRQTYVVPFAFDTVARVAWQAFSSHHERQNRLLELYCKTEELFACKFAGRPLSQTSDTTTSAATVVAKCFSSPSERSVVVSRAFISSQDSTYRQAVAVSTGWVAFQPIVSEPDYTLVDVCIRTVPHQCTLASLARLNLVRLPSESAEVTTFVSQKLCTISEDMIALIEEIENIVLDESATIVKET